MLAEKIQSAPPSSSGRKRRYEKKDILIVVLITVVSLGIMEIACRILGTSGNANADFRFYIRQVDNDLRLDYVVEDPFLMWALKPGYKGGPIAISSMGFRDIEYDKKKNAGVFRILCLGDSTTFGYGIPLESTYHSLLEDRLNCRQERGGRRYDVINAGVVGYTSLQGLGMLLFRGAEFKPDLVTAYFGVNETICRFYLSDADIMKLGRPQWLKTFINKWLLKSEIVRVLHKLKNGEEKTGRKPTARISSDDYRNTILRLKDACQQNGARLLLISPALQVDGHQADDRVLKIIRYRRVLEQTAVEAGIPLLTIPELTEYASGDSSALFLTGDSVHPNRAGHRLIMQRLYDFIIENGLLQ